jgi:hypothetical protein
MPRLFRNQTQVRRARWRSAATARGWIAGCVVLAIVGGIAYVAWEFGGPFRISNVSVARTTSEGTVDGFIVMASGKGAPPAYSSAKVKSVVLVDSESDPHFRINVALWDGRERELKVHYVMEPLDPAVTKLPDRKTQIQSQLARTRKDGVVSVKIEYEDVSWLRRKDLVPEGTGVQSVPVSIVKG